MRTFWLTWAGAPSREYSLDRKDNDGNYEPSNCKWATNVEQANNRRSNIVIEYLGRTQTLKQWCDELGVPYVRAKARIHAGHTPDEAFMNTPKGLRRDSVMVEMNGRTQTITQWSKELGVTYNTIKRKVKRQEKLKLLQLLT